MIGKSNLKKNFVIVFLTAGVCFAPSCTKNPDEISDKLDQEMQAKVEAIPEYSSWGEVNSVIEKASSCENIDELARFEVESNRSSIGRLSIEFYSKIDLNSLGSKEELLDLWQNNMRYFDTSIVENGEIFIHPKWFDSPFRYVANEEGLFRIGEKVFRLFKKEVVSCNIEYFDMLLSLREDCLNNLNESIFSSSSKMMNNKGIHDSCGYGSFQAEATKGSNDKMVVRITAGPVAVLDSDTEVNYLSSMTIYNRHRTLGIWLPCTHLVSCQASISIHQKESYKPEWEIKNYVFTINSSFISNTWPMSAFMDDHTGDIHFYSYHVSATVGGFTTARLDSMR